MFNIGKLKQQIKAFLQQLLFAAHAKVSGGKHQSILWTYKNFDLTPYNILLKGYFQGVVPLPETSNNQNIEWLDPEFRGIVPIEGFKIGHDIKHVLKKNKDLPEDKRFVVKINTNFRETLENCAKPRRKTSRTWLSAQYIDAAVELHKIGVAHSIETYQNGEMVGGIIGYAINGYFADITMFNTVNNASKVGYCFLLQKLKEDGFKLHDSGFGGNWFGQFGAVDTPREEFKMNLAKAIVTQVKFTSIPEIYSEILQQVECLTHI